MKIYEQYVLKDSKMKMEKLRNEKLIIKTNMFRNASRGPVLSGTEREGLGGVLGRGISQGLECGGKTVS